MLARLATFALIPLSVAIAVSAPRLARLGFYYSKPSQTFVCFRCRQTFRVDDELSGLETHERLCSSPAAATRSTALALQQQAACHNDHKNSNSCFTATSSEVTSHTSCLPTHFDGIREETRSENINSINVSGEYSEVSNIIHNSSSTLRHQPDFKRLKDETVRLSTFYDWPETAARIVEPRDLARAGFFYTGQIDRVQCAFCRGCLHSWVQGDRAADEHRRHFPNCPFIRQMNDDVTAAATSSPSRSRHQLQLYTTDTTLSSDKSCHKLQQSFQVGLIVSATMLKGYFRSLYLVEFKCILPCTFDPTPLSAEWA